MTKARSNVVTDFVLPIGVLTAICLVMSLLLALTNFATRDAIAAAELKETQEAMTEVMPDAENFEPVAVENLPENITGVYKATNGVGYVFMITSDGYGGRDTLNMVCGIGPDGTITATKVISHEEDPGMGSRVADAEFSGQFPGKDAALEGVDTISGSTVSSTYYINAIKDAFTAYNMVKEG